MFEVVIENLRYDFFYSSCITGDSGRIIAYEPRLSFMLLDWFTSNICGEWSHIFVSHNTNLILTLQFEEVSDAVLFKLTWC